MSSFVKSDNNFNKVFISLLFYLIPLFSFAQQSFFRGVITDSLNSPIPYVSIQLVRDEIIKTASSDERGNFMFSDLAEGTYQIILSCLGYEKKKIMVDIVNDNGENIPITIILFSRNILISDVTVAASRDLGRTMNSVSNVDILLRPVNSAQDLMRLVPGLFLAQHQGGGKAEQIFLRGFDADHGTDFAVFWDGIPVNMPSHAHGQGYADSHFMIPECIDQLDVYKGTYTTMYGDFATAGTASFTTKNYTDNLFKAEYGNYGYYRVMGIMNLIGKDKHFLSKFKESTYLAAEYSYNKTSYFVHPQDYSRLSVSGKYYGQLTNNTTLTFEGSYFNSTWNGSGQIPTRAVTEGLITRFGALDPSEGGQTNRTNVNAILKTFFDNGGILKNQIYYSYYELNLYTDFTFFLADTVHGDGINQRDKGRNIFGYNGSLEFYKDIAGRKLKTVIGLSSRIDAGQLSLRTQEKRVISDTLTMGRLYEQNACVYLDETYNLSNRFVINAGVRADIFYLDYTKMTGFNLADTAIWGIPPTITGKKTAVKISPKLSLYYNLNPSVQFFIRAGYGFHSNDARAVVANPGVNTLPAALGYEIGSIFKPFDNMLVNAVLWGIHLQNELTYDQDIAADVVNGPTQRLGADLSVRYQFTRLLFFDADINYSHGRFTDSVQGKNYIPLAPTLTSIAGLTIIQNGFSCSLRYRYIDNRPADNNNSIVAPGYFLTDAVAKYKVKKIEFGLTVQNIFNINWNEAEFATLTRLKGEPAGGFTDLCFTPGAPRLIRGSLSVCF
jgi:hypothetical protein